VASAPVLRAGLAGDEAARLATPPTSSIEAFQHYGQARALLEARDIKGNVDGAIRLLEGATRTDPKFALAHAALGDAYWAKYGETADTSWSSRAAQSILEAVALDPETPQIRISLARVFQGTSRVDQAIEELRRALAQQPNNDEAHRLLGMALAENDQIDAAVAELRQAIEIRPDYWEHHYILGNRLHRAGRYTQAADEFREVIRLRPESERGHRMLGATFHAMGDTARALDSYQRAQSIAPSAGTYANIGVLYYRKGEYEQAAASYRRAIELKPLEPIFHFNLGSAEEKLGSGKAPGSFKRAAELLNGQLAVKPDDAQTRSQLALCQLNLGETDAALANAERAVTRAPRDPEVLYRRAAVYATRGQTKEALAAIVQAIDAGFSVDSALASDFLEPLRTNIEFKALLERARQKQAARQ
jgi:tetratricopeptide (TPR) repeat protein